MTSDIVGRTCVVYILLLQKQKRNQSITRTYILVIVKGYLIRVIFDITVAFCGPPCIMALKTDRAFIAVLHLNYELFIPVSFLIVPTMSHVSG